ncbi:MAG: gliding motility-associated C-terminal domain-containing protein, partial [Bacteroidota bacterium]
TSVTTTYTVTITESTCNESATLNTTLTILPPLNISTSKSNDIDCSNGSAKLSAFGATQFEWSPVKGLNDPYSASPIASPLATQQYIVKGSNDAGCIGYDTVTVFADFTNAAFYAMPSAFTPDGDGLNDCYRIKYWGSIQQLEFRIYNRWGELVFYTNNPDDCWNGRHKGQPADAGAYVYYIKAITACGKVEKKGSVVLAR